MSYDVIGYIYEAAIHCPDCTRERFPKLRGRDSEGNDIGAYFEQDAQEYVADSGGSLVCDDCGEILCEFERDEDQEPDSEPPRPKLSIQVNEYALRTPKRGELRLVREVA